MKIVIATRNADKYKEIKQILGQRDIEILSLSDFPDAPDVEETGTTLEENALLKAKSAAEATGLAAIADDTGLLVDVLEGAPGVKSARFAGENATYEENCSLLLSKLDGVQEENRTAKFVCIAALVDKKSSLTANGEVEGVIITEQRGTNGFGYDPIFMPDRSNLTFGEMTIEEKSTFSHRGIAFNEMLRIIKDMRQ